MEYEKKRFLKIIHAKAPLRINDIGGWTDTWFAKQGKVLNLAVSPGVEVQISVYENKEKKEERVSIFAENYGERFTFNPDFPSRQEHPLLQFAVASVPFAKEMELEINLFSPVPAGISTGTSASVCVALLGALLHLTGKEYSPPEVASLAHRVETEKLGEQSGIQDQISAACGGICFIDMYEYPHSRIQKLSIHMDTRNELERRICLIYLGKPHRSSSIHERVIALLEKGESRFDHLERLRALAIQAKEVLEKGDLESYGEVMILNNETQRSLCKELISREADEVIELAKHYGAAGWKVNGAGGEGGSLTILAASDDGLRRAMLREIEKLEKGIRPLPVALSPSGLEVWECEKF